MTSDGAKRVFRRRLLTGVVSAAIVACAVSAAAGAAAAAQPRAGAKAPPLVLRGLDGSTLDLGLPTGQVVVVNLWATWCTPCRAEMPMLNAFALQHRSAGVMVVGVSVDRSRDKDEVRRVMSAFAYPAGLLSESGGDLDPPRLMPTTYVIDKAGVVRAVFGGPVTAEALEAAVQPLL